MNYLGLCKELRSKTGVAGQGPMTVANQTGDYSRLVGWVNDAYVEIQNKWLDWKFLWLSGTTNTIIGTPLYSLPSTCKILNEDSVYVGGQKLSALNYEDYRQQRDLYDGMPRGAPDEFTVRPDGKVLLFPTPNAVKPLAFEYQRRPHKLVLDGDLPLIPEEHHEAIIWRGKMFWAEYEEAAEQYQTALTNFNLAMTRLEAYQLPSQEYAHGRVQGANIVIRAV